MIIAARPFAKWVGGKRSTADLIGTMLPQKIRTYYEPMVGGGAVFFHLANARRFKHAWLNDVNPELMVTYQQVRDNTSMLAVRLSKLANDAEVFESVRSQDPSKLAWVDRAARMIYLNKTAFNGLYRVNRAGKFNAPFGRYENPRILDADNLTACCLALRGVELTCSDYERVVQAAGPGDAVYFDPPYIPVSAAGDTKSFTSYSPDGFGFAMQERLSHMFAHLARKGVAVMASNADTPEARFLYKGYGVVETQVRRSVNSDGGGRGKVGELLFYANCLGEEMARTTVRGQLVGALATRAGSL